MTPSKFAVEVTPVKSTYLVNANDIEADHSQNGRFKSGKIEGLMQSIRDNGQLQPISVIRTKPEGKLKLKWGFGRLEAIRKINEGLPPEQQIKVRVELFNGNEDEAFFANADENMVRNDLSPMDKAIVFRRMITQFGMKQTDIAKRYKKTPAWVSQHVSLLSLETLTQNKVHSGDIPFKEALTMVNMTAEDRFAVVTTVESAQAQAQAEAVTHDIQKKVSRKAAVKAVKIIADAKKVKENKLVKRSFADIHEFFDVMNGSPAVSKRTQALAAFMVGFLMGTPEQEDEAVEALEKIMK